VAAGATTTIQIRALVKSIVGEGGMVTQPANYDMVCAELRKRAQAGV